MEKRSNLGAIQIYTSYQKQTATDSRSCTARRQHARYITDINRFFNILKAELSIFCKKKESAFGVCHEPKHAAEERSQSKETHCKVSVSLIFPLNEVDMRSAVKEEARSDIISNEGSTI